MAAEAPLTEPIRPASQEPSLGPGQPALSPPHSASKALLAALFVGGLVLGYVLYDRLPSIGSETGSGVAQLATARAERGDLRWTLRLGGTISAESFAAIVAPRLRFGRRSNRNSGRGSQMTLINMAEPGSRVEAGSIVAEFDRQSQQERIDDQQAQVTQAESQILFRQANLAIELENTRQQARVAKAAHQKAALDSRTAEVRSAIEAEILALAVKETEATSKQLDEEARLLEIAQQAALRQVEIERDQQRVDLDRAEMNAKKMAVRTPISGTVVMMTLFRSGTFMQVAPGDEVYSGAYFMQIVDPARMLLEASLNQADAQNIRPGQKAEIRLDAYADKVWKGRVVSVAAMTGSGGGSRRFRTGTGEHVRNITVKLAIDESDSLIIPDLSASADVLLEAETDALLVPREALTREGDDWFVLVRSEGGQEPERRSVEVGSRNETHAAVNSGLQEGEEVILGAVRMAGL